MAQFDVYANPSRTSKAFYPYLVDIQNPQLLGLATRIVIPLGKIESLSGLAMKGLTPEVSFDGEALLLLTPQISSIYAKQLRNPVGSLAHFRDQIISALDFAITGI